MYWLNNIHSAHVLTMKLRILLRCLASISTKFTISSWNVYAMKFIMQPLGWMKWWTCKKTTLTHDGVHFYMIELTRMLNIPKCECDNVYVRHWTYIVYWSKWQDIQNQSKWKQLGELAMGVGRVIKKMCLNSITI